MLILFKLLAIFLQIYLAQSARILGIFHMPTYSHFQLGNTIFKELAAKGHEVTIITPFELKDPVKNIKHIVLTGFFKQVEEFKAQLFFQDFASNLPAKVVMFNIMGYNFTESVLIHPNVQQLLKSSAQFDLVIQEVFANEAFAGFASHYKAPLVLVSPHSATRWINSKMGNPHSSAYIPDFLLDYTKNMNLFQRVVNTLADIFMQLMTNLYTLPNQNQLLLKYFPGSPPLDELNYNASLVLINSHVSTHNPLPLLPNMVEIGGYHIQPPKPLPKDLQDYLDSSQNGVVFFSMGSNLNSKDMPIEKRNMILKTLGKLKQNVLWKWEDEVLPGQPKNVKIGKWFPQLSILAHPNLKLFITHGGLLSTTEAVHFGVPVLGLPVYGDQQTNMLNAESDGYGIGIPFKDVDETSFSAALHNLLNNPKYTQNVKTRSQIMNDRPMKPLDTAVYWIEYVIRHHGAPHLKSPALSLKWYQNSLLDVAVVITISIAIVLYLLSKFVKLLCGKSQTSKSEKKKKRE